MAAAVDVAAEGDVPLLVRVLAGNPATSAAILSCLNTADARHLRQLHPAVAGVVVIVPWCDTDTPVVDGVRWRAGLPAAVGARLAPSATGRWPAKPTDETPKWDWLTSEVAMVVLGGITHLDLHDCRFVTDQVLLRLPASLRVLNEGECTGLSGNVSFVHLASLASLDCSGTWAVTEGAGGLPPSLQELDISGARELPSYLSLAHLRLLRVLRAEMTRLSTTTLESLPPSLEELDAAHCTRLTPAVSFAHLTALRKLDIAHSTIGDASLATMPACLLHLNVRKCVILTPAAALPHLPALQLLDVSCTSVGDALVASLPASLIELRLSSCRRVTPGANLDHLHTLRVLHCIDTELAPAALAACRERGCVVPAARQLRGHNQKIGTLVLLGDARWASTADDGGEVRVWDVAVESEATVVLEAGVRVRALAALPDGRRLAIGTTLLAWGHDIGGCVQVWDVGCVPPSHRATIDCCSGVTALAVLPDGRLAVGCTDGAVRIVDADAGAVVATLTGHTDRVSALAVLPDGAVVSGSDDASVRVWDVSALVCVATLVGHTSGVCSLAVLADGRLASMARDVGAVWLWDVRARACVGVLTGHTGDTDMRALAALPDGRLATASNDNTIRLWDTRPAAAASASRAVGAVPVEVVGVRVGITRALLSIPDGRLACVGDTGSGALCLLELPPPAMYE